MDDGRFDALTRVLGAARSRRGAIGALAALFGGVTIAGAAAAETDAERRRRRRRRRCKPKCPAGQTCNRDTRTCFCQNGGTVCGVNCCLPGTSCESGSCVPLVPPDTCHALGEACTGDNNIPCCGTDLTCGSGQGGKRDVACYKKAGAACAADSECTYGTRCTGGECTLIEPPPVPRCNSTNCAGCCSGDICVRISDQNGSICGAGGAICEPCGAGSVCASGVCAPFVCDSTSCADGCCVGNTCVPFSSQTAAVCGTGGAACTACTAPNETCNVGTGVCEVTGTCNAGTCATGCCQGNTCVPFASQTGTVCGTGGAACTACPTLNPTCNTATGICEVSGTCGSLTCPDGCCQGNVCLPGDTSLACGINGDTCVACSGGTPACDPLTGTCVAAT